MEQKRKETIKWVVNIIASILTALATALGTVSCVQ
ncbi:MAG: smalltalk protein [Bacteroidales bacterium]|nr:smalltalk protein [Candidatus Liminaster caballi]